ncbi:NAD-dependent epimerase/dehydratase family protein [Nonomuraea ferruginea]
MKIFITGGSGFVGGTLVHRLLAEGHEVMALARSGSSIQRVRAAGAEPVSGDLAELGLARLPGAELARQAARGRRGRARRGVHGVLGARLALRTGQSRADGRPVRRERRGRGATLRAHQRRVRLHGQSTPSRRRRVDAGGLSRTSPTAGSSWPPSARSWQPAAGRPSWWCSARRSSGAAE